MFSSQVISRIVYISDVKNRPFIIERLLSHDVLSPLLAMALTGLALTLTPTLTLTLNLTLTSTLTLKLFLTLTLTLTLSASSMTIRQISTRVVCLILPYTSPSKVNTIITSIIPNAPPSFLEYLLVEIGKRWNPYFETDTSHTKLEAIHHTEANHLNSFLQALMTGLSMQVNPNKEWSSEVEKILGEVFILKIYNHIITISDHNHIIYYPCHDHIISMS